MALFKLHILISSNKFVKLSFLDREKQFIVKDLSVKEKVPWVWCIIIAFSIPEMLTFIKSWITYWKNRYKHETQPEDEETGPPESIFTKLKNKISCGAAEKEEAENSNDVEMFSYLIWMFVSAVETCHVIGLALLIFYILPNLDVVKGVMLTNCVCLIPSILNLISSMKEIQKNKSPISAAKICIDILAILVQLTAFFMWPLAGTDSKLWAIPVALFLMSIHYWENFINPLESIVILDGLKRIKNNMDVMRYTYYKFVSLWKIICFFLMALLITYFNGISVENFFDLQAGFGAHTINITEVSNSRL